eukprot:30154-Rhodomonas_salina.2
MCGRRLEQENGKDGRTEVDANCQCPQPGDSFLSSSPLNCLSQICNLSLDSPDETLLNYNMCPVDCDVNAPPPPLASASATLDLSRLRYRRLLRDDKKRWKSMVQSSFKNDGNFEVVQLRVHHNPRRKLHNLLVGLSLAKEVGGSRSSEE